MKLLFVVNDSGFFISHRLPIARAARRDGWEVHVATPDGDHVDDILNSGFAHHTISLTRQGTVPWKEVKSIFGLIQLFQLVQPDVVHNITIKPMIYGGIASRRARVPAVVHAVTGLGHVFTSDGLKAKLMRRGVKMAYRWAFRHSNMKVIFQNPDDQNTMLSTNLIKSDSAALIRGSGVDVEKYTVLPEATGEKVVLFASRMLWPKGVREFVDASRKLKSEGYSARFVLVGDTDSGNPAAVPKEKLKSWAHEGIIEWWGHQEDMIEVFRRSHIICLPSSYGEGVPKVLIEAAACGRPIVTTDTPGCREVVRHGVNGILVPRKNSDAVADAVKQLLASPVTRTKMGRAGREIVVNEFSQTQVIEQTLQVYRELSDKVPRGQKGG